MTSTISVSPSFVPTSSPSNSPTPAFIPQSDRPRTLSGGWVFIIILVCSGSVYFLGGMFYSYRTTGVWDPPHRHFWSSTFSYVDDGVDYVINCGRPKGLSGGAGVGGSGGGFAPPTAPPPGFSGGYNAGSGTGSAYANL